MKSRKAKILAGILAAALAAASLTACGSSSDSSDNIAASSSSSSSDSSGETVTLRVGASPTPHAEILEEAKPILAEQGVDLEIVTMEDTVTPNTSLEAGEIDANYFQHVPFMEDFNEQNDGHLVSAGAIHYEPFGIYAGKTKSLDDLKDGATVAVPNNTTNEARALLLLEQEGLIELDDPSDINVTTQNITENPKNLQFKEIAPEQLTRSLQDVDIAVINGNYAIEGGLSVKDALATEDSDSVAAETYANVIAVKEGNENNEAIKKLVKVLQSQEIKDFINSKYDGAVVPADNSTSADSSSDSSAA